MLAALTACVAGLVSMHDLTVRLSHVFACVVQDNVALIAVLEMVEQQSGSKQLLCVANTHIHANPELNDVKLWQVHTLLKGLEKIANRWVEGGAGRGALDVRSGLVHGARCLGEGSIPCLG